MNKLYWTRALSLAAILVILGTARARAEIVDTDELGVAPSWSPATVEDVRRDVYDWLADQSLEPKVQSRIESLWPPREATVAAEELVIRIVETYALVEPKAQQLIERCNRPFSDTAPPKLGLFLTEESPAIFGNNIKLFYASWLARSQFYDECLQTLEGLSARDVVDPASLLFYRAVAYHRLVQSEPCLDAISQLLEREQELPERFGQLAQLMQLDIHDLKKDSLSHISRRMGDVERRLQLGRSGERVRKVEEGVIESLDKLIKDIEKKQKQQQSASAGGGSAPQAPMQDSQLGRAQGAGKVDKKPIGSKSGWGNLPPKQREEALQQIGREFPSHYREVIEQYFKKLASEDTNPEP